ncbi:probable carboxylesterase 12 [Aristolochia californica]|uniref:probable carboxylesterase 12 n=1 Tax=Aristolochia californica TaxID=171875 RepID=UPI0035E0B284
MEVEKEIETDFQPVCIVYKDGSVKLFEETEELPPGDDSKTGVSSRDVTISGESDVGVRLFLPRIKSGRKFPIVVYLHGGLYVGGSPSSSLYHPYQNQLAGKSRVLVVGVDFHRPPEVPFSTSMEDVWTVMKWVASHADGSGPDPWLSTYADYEKLIVMGDCTGCILVNSVPRRAIEEKLPNGVKINGMVMMHPCFWGSEAIQGEEEYYGSLCDFSKGLWMLAEPGSCGTDDPKLNPTGPLAPPLTDISCRRALICSAEKDWLKFRAWDYYSKLGSSGWAGDAEYWETDSEDHLFHLYDPGNEDAKFLLKRVGAFLNGLPAPPIMRRVTALF